MQVKPDQLLNQLRQSLPPLVWVAGDDPLLRQECCDTVRHVAQEQEFSEREVFNVDTEFSWNDLLYAANSLSLFGERKVLDLRLPTSKLSNDARQSLQAYLEHPSADNLLLITSPRVEKAAQQSKWFRQIENAGLFVAVWPIRPNELPGWIKQRLTRHGLSADPDAIKLLAERVEGNLLAASQEIEKLGILCGQQHIDMQAVMQAVADSARFDVFGLIDAALAGQAGRALKILDHLHAEGEETLLVLNMLCRELRLLITMRLGMEQGQNMNGVLQKHRVWQNRRQVVGRALEHHDSARLSELLRDARVVEQSVKGQLPNSPWDELGTLLLRLAAVPSALGTGQSSAQVSQ